MYKAEVIRKTYLDSTRKVELKNNTLIAKFDFYEETDADERQEIRERIRELLNETDASDYSIKCLYCKDPNNSQYSVSFFPTHIFEPRYSLGFGMKTQFSDDDFRNNIDLKKLNYYILTGKLSANFYKPS